MRKPLKQKVLKVLLQGFIKDWKTETILYCNYVIFSIIIPAMHSVFLDLNN